jgi:hypothetical protein
MARGMVVGEPVVSQAQTKEFDEGYERTFGKPDGSAKGGRWVWDAQAKKLVSAEEYVPPEAKRGAGIMVDRFMEGDRAPDGTDIGSRQKRKAWMAATGNADFSDFKGARERRAKEEAARKRGEFKPDKPLRDLIGRELYKQKVIL